METIMHYIKPELLVVAIALYFIGLALKRTSIVKDKWIPMILGGVGIALCMLWIFSQCSCGNPGEVAAAIFTALIQGVLVAAASTYVNQIVKQSCKDE